MVTFSCRYEARPPQYTLTFRIIASPEEMMWLALQDASICIQTQERQIVAYYLDELLDERWHAFASEAEARTQQQVLITQMVDLAQTCPMTIGDLQVSFAVPTWS